ncbi:unnamed protein product, partial [Scytosiphon promiscuus]
ITGDLLGKGGFGEVYLADYNGHNAAAKVWNESLCVRDESWTQSHATVSSHPYFPAFKSCKWTEGWDG